MILWQSFLRLLSADYGISYSVKTSSNIKINSICCCPSFRGIHVPPKVAQRSTSRKEEGSWVKNGFWNILIKQWINSFLRFVVVFALCRTLLCWRWQNIMWRVTFHISVQFDLFTQYNGDNQTDRLQSLNVEHLPPYKWLTHSVQLL